MKIGGVNGGSYLLFDDDVSLDEAPPRGTKAVIVNPRRNLVTEPRRYDSVIMHGNGHWGPYDGDLTAEDALAQAGAENHGDTIASLATHYSEGDAVRAPGGRGVVVEVLTEVPDEIAHPRIHGDVSEEYPAYRIEFEHSSTELFTGHELYPPDRR